MLVITYYKFGTELMSDNTPKKFVNLHGHSDLGSIGDAIGAPQDHIDFAVSNGSDALALTDHGNLQGFSSQFLHAKKLKDKGVNFKAISGVEAYYIPSLKDWRVAKNEASLEKDNAKEAKRVSKLSAKDIGDELASTKAELTELAGEVVKADEDEMGGTVIENDEETRSNKWRNPVNRRNHLVLLAKNSEGLKAIFRLVSASYIDGFYRYPRIDMEMLKKEAKGNVIASSACVSGNPMYIVAGHQTEKDFNLWFPNDNNFELIQSELKTMIEEFKDALGEENYNLELQFHNLPAQHLLNYHLIEASKRTNTPLIVTCDSHYSRPEHWKARELYKAMAWASKTKGAIDATKLPERIEDLKCELYPKNAEQLWASYKQYTEPYDFYDDGIVKDAIERTWDIAHNQIGDVSFNRSVKLPVIEQLVSKADLNRAIEKLGSSEDEDAIAFEELKRIAKNGLITRGKEEEEEYIARLVYELGVIKELKFSKYFLTFSKIMSVVSKDMLIGYGRGSAGGSLLSYCLGITQVDPIKYGLLFERFLTRLKKNSFPDIDVDFADREKAVKLISDYFGEENVVSVSNFNKLQLRSLLKDVSRFANIPFDEINKYTGKIEAEALAEAKKTPGFDRAMWVLTYEEAETNSASFRELMTKYPDLEANVKVLFKQMRNLSRHASGVIITSNARENMPIIKSGDVLQTPWPEGLNARHLEDFGLLKFDILGLGTLRIVENTIRKIIRKTTGEKYITFDMIKQWYEDNLHPDKLDLSDKHVYENVWRDGKYAGVFQFISANVQKFMTNMKPMSINDLAIGTSIFRPGPLAAGVDKLYLNNRSHPNKIEYKHPLQQEVLGETAGVMVFQEQLQMMYHKLAGVPLEETDSIRKAFTKKDLSNKEKAAKDRAALREDFADKCLAVNDIPKKISYEIFDDMEKMVAYSFNKSHAVAYSIISYTCAWLLTYHSSEWITSYIDYCATEKGKQAGKEDPKAIAISEAKGLGFSIAKPDINHSERDYVIIDEQLIPSFSSLKHVGTTVLNEINEFRPYKSIEDLLFNADDTWRHSKFNKRALSTLVKLEGFASMGLVGDDCMFKNYRQLHYVLIEKGDDLKKAATKKKKTHRADLATYIEEAQELDDWSLGEKVEFSKSLSGMVDIDMIVTPDIADYFRKQGIASIDNREDDDQWVWCIVKSAKEAKTKAGKPYMRMKVYGASCTDMEIFVWNFKPPQDRLIPDNSLIIGRFKKTDFGMSSFFGGLEIIGQ